jgi:hypothetical protein
VQGRVVTELVDARERVVVEHQRLHPQPSARVIVHPSSLQTADEHVTGDANSQAPASPRRRPDAAGSAPERAELDCISGHRLVGGAPVGGKVVVGDQNRERTRG